MFPIILPNFDPVIFSLGPIAIRWYSLSYIMAFVFVFFAIKYFSNKEDFMSKDMLDSWLNWSILGVIIGGRLGYIIFYDLSFYLNYPLEMIKIWKGGMSFHGGLIGSIVSMFFFCRKYNLHFLKLTDILAISCPMGLFFGRIANFINIELYGRPTNSNFGVIFPNVDNVPRHPSQLYEAFLEGLLIFIILSSLTKLTDIRQKYGILSALFLILYSVFRMIIEQFRVPDEQIGLILDYFTMGQILSFSMLLFGILLITQIIRKK